MATPIRMAQVIKNVSLSEIVAISATHARVQMDLDIAEDYAERMAQGDVFPAVVVYHDGQVYHLADGFHRFRAAQVLGRESILAEVRPGTQRDAVLCAAQSNAAHGLQRSRADKVRAVEMLLNDSEWTMWSDREIARQTRVSHPFVAKVRARIAASGNVTRSERLVRRVNHEYQMDIRGLQQAEKAVNIDELSVVEDHGAGESTLGALEEAVEPVFTSQVGDNAALIAHAARLYIPDRADVADITYGKGVFWRSVDTQGFKSFHPSDLLTLPDQQHDFRDLPYADESMDVVIFDPPYVHNPGALIVEANYRNAETTGGMFHDDIIELYREGMHESMRILRVGGTLWVKCKDEIESSIQRWSHIELYEIARGMGLYAKDLFILTQNARPYIQHVQKHARKNHSYLWIFERRPSRLD